MFGEWLVCTVDYRSFCSGKIGLLESGLYGVNFLFLLKLNAREYFRSYVCMICTGAPKDEFLRW